jgi:heptosyltransferase-2
MQLLLFTRGNTSFDNLILLRKSIKKTKWEYFKLWKSIRAEKNMILSLTPAYSKLEELAGRIIF